MQQISLVAFYEDKGLGTDFEDKLKQMIMDVKPEDIKRIANLYIKEPFVLTVLAPQKYLNFKV